MPENTEDQTTTASAEQETKKPEANAGAEKAAAQQASAAAGQAKPAAGSQAANESAGLGVHLFDPTKLGVLNDVSLLVTIEIGRTQIKIRDLLNLSKGSIIELNKAAGEPVDIYANGKLISTGNIITANGKYCVRLSSIPESSQIEVESNGK